MFMYECPEIPEICPKEEVDEMAECCPKKCGKKLPLKIEMISQADVIHLLEPQELTNVSGKIGKSADS